MATPLSVLVTDGRRPVKIKKTPLPAGLWAQRFEALISLPSNNRSMLGDDDQLEARLAILELIKVTDGEISNTPKRTDVTQPDKISKLRKCKETQNKTFNGTGVTVYRRLRKDFFKVCNAQGILVVLLFNYQSQDGVGLTIKDWYGQYDFKITKGPFGLSIDDCEQEAGDILDAMIFPGLLAVNWPK